jgi:hypothetical protein
MVIFISSIYAADGDLYDLGNYYICIIKPGNLDLHLVRKDSLKKEVYDSLRGLRKKFTVTKENLFSSFEDVTIVQKVKFHFDEKNYFFFVVNNIIFLMYKNEKFYVKPLTDDLDYRVSYEENKICIINKKYYEVYERKENKFIFMFRKYIEHILKYNINKCYPLFKDYEMRWRHYLELTSRDGEYGNLNINYFIKWNCRTHETFPFQFKDEVFNVLCSVKYIPFLPGEIYLLIFEFLAELYIKDLLFSHPENRIEY